MGHCLRLPLCTLQRYPFMATSYHKKSINKQNRKIPSLQQTRAIDEKINRLVSIPIGGWDGIFIRELIRWRDIALRDGRQFSLSEKQQAHLSRIVSRYLGGGKK